MAEESGLLVADAVVADAVVADAVVADAFVADEVGPRAVWKIQ